MSYDNGVEDAIELCLAETEDSKTKDEAIEKLKFFLRLIKENKFDQMKKRIGYVDTLRPREDCEAEAK